ncbi:hypothetical protein [Alcanivorax sp. 1008]|uniref:hypothetical protein n=1 Tax=Alcanivorax sp. 1008 TaxID=2816853 RepID=UPI001DDF653F|nr:hypothetical protein [Alcanivorax sp. 1008]MCC1496818.1 hypothetical protein [Alcanivorax sp. 1008]
MSDPTESILDRAQRRLWEFERTICLAGKTELDRKVISEYTYMLNIKAAYPPVIIDEMRYGYTPGLRPEAWQMLAYYESRFNPPAQQADIAKAMLARTRMFGATPFSFSYEEMHAIATEGMEILCPNPALFAIETYLDEINFLEGRSSARKAKSGFLALGPSPQVE